MTRTEIFEKLRALMKSTSQVKANWDAVTEADTIAALGFDSLSVLDLIYEIQQSFQVELEPKEIVKVRTVGDLITLLEKNIKPG